MNATFYGQKYWQINVWFCYKELLLTAPRECLVSPRIQQASSQCLQSKPARMKLGKAIQSVGTYKSTAYFWLVGFPGVFQWPARSISEAKIICTLDKNHIKYAPIPYMIQTGTLNPQSIDHLSQTSTTISDENEPTDCELKNARVLRRRSKGFDALHST